MLLVNILRPMHSYFIVPVPFIFAGFNGKVNSDLVSYFGRVLNRTIETANGKLVVEDTIKLRGGKFGHVGYMASGMLSAGETVTLKVDEQARRDTEKNHSATHLLQ